MLAHRPCDLFMARDLRMYRLQQTPDAKKNETSAYRLWWLRLIILRHERWKCREQKMLRPATSEWKKDERIKEQCKRIIHGTKTNVDDNPCDVVGILCSNLPPRRKSIRQRTSAFSAHIMFDKNVEMCETACATSPTMMMMSECCTKQQPNADPSEWQNEKKEEIIKKRTEAIYSMQSQNK